MVCLGVGVRSMGARKKDLDWRAHKAEIKAAVEAWKPGQSNGRWVGPDCALAGEPWFEAFHWAWFEAFSEVWYVALRMGEPWPAHEFILYFIERENV